MGKREKFMFDLKPAPGVTERDWYLSAINVFATELRKYEDVELINDSVLKAWQEKCKMEIETDIYMSHAYKAQHDGRTMQSLIDEYGYEVLGFSEETHKRMGIK